MHYHLMSVTEHSQILANVIYDEWPEALQTYHTMAYHLFGHAFDEDEFTIEHAAEAMRDSEGEGVFTGARSLSLALMCCEDECEWSDPTWN